MAWDDDAYETELEIPSGRYGKLIAVPGGPGPSGPVGPAGPAGPAGPPGPAEGVEFVANKGIAGGYTPLDAAAKVDARYLPSYVDDVLEFPTRTGFPATGETGKIYVAIDTGNTYRWTGSTYVAISDKVTSTGITDSTAIGRSLITAKDAATARKVLNIPRTLTNPTWTVFGDSFARPTYPAVVAIGDSITAYNSETGNWNGTNGSRKYTYAMRGYLTWGMVLARQPANYWQCGVPQQLSNNGLDRFDTDVAALLPSVVIEAFGVNDIINNKTAETIFTNRLAMWNKAWDIGASVIATTTMSYSAFTAAQLVELDRLNTMLRNFAATNPARFALADFWAATVDPLTGFPKPDVTSDGIHPNNLGGLLLGQKLAVPLARFLPNTHPLLATGGANLVDNGLLTGTTGTIAGTTGSGITGQGADGWTFGSFRNAAEQTTVISKVARSDGYGQWQQFNSSKLLNAADPVVMHRDARAEWAVGDVVQSHVEYEIDDGWTPGLLTTVLQCRTATSPSVLHEAISMTGNVWPQRSASGILTTPPIEVPAGTTILRMHVYAGGLGPVRVGRVAVHKIPKA